jgi:tetratricopeptide (TPR) repeat protein
MRHKILLVHSLIIGFLMSGAAVTVPAQSTAADKNALIKFEKSIEAGDYAAVERDLLGFAIEHPREAKGFELLARMRFNQNRLTEAKSLYQKVLLLDPLSTSAKINLAVINFRTGNSGAALSALSELTEKDLSGDAPRLQLAQAFALAGDCRSALTTSEKLSLRVKNGEALALRAECHLKLGENREIAALLPPAGALVKQNPALALKFAEVLINGRLFNEAAGILRAVVKTHPQRADAFVSLARAEIYLKDFADAKSHLAQAAKINAGSPDLFFVRGLLESEEGKNAESLVSLEKALAAAPAAPAFLRQYVISAIRANENGKAVKAAEKLLQLGPDEPDFLYLHGAAALQNGNLKAAENSLTRFFELRPADPRGCVALGLVFAAQADKLEVARRQMEKCIEINPGNTEAKYQLGLSYQAQGETAKAIEYFEATVSDAPGYASALRNLGAAYLQTGAEAKARPVLEKAVALDPNDADAHFQLSRLYNLIGETDLAKKHLGIFQKLKNPKKDGM